MEARNCVEAVGGRLRVPARSLDSGKSETMKGEREAPPASMRSRKRSSRFLVSRPFAE
jgi:hypothetical protein